MKNKIAFLFLFSLEESTTTTIKTMMTTASTTTVLTMTTTTAMTSAATTTTATTTTASTGPGRPLFHFDLDLARNLGFHFVTGSSSTRDGASPDF